MKVSRDDLQALREKLPKARIIVSAKGLKGTAAILEDHFALLGSVGWDIIAWQEIQSGSWDAKNGVLAWELLDGARGGIKLDDPGDLPLVFAEKIRASIITETNVDLGDGLGKVTIAGRRAASGGKITWTVYALGAMDLADEKVKKRVIEKTKLIQKEYDN